MKNVNKLLMNKKVLNYVNEKIDDEFNVKENEYTIINYFSENAQSFNLNIKQEKNSYCILNISLFIKADTSININNIILSDNNKFIINLRVIGAKNHGNINVNSQVKAHTKNNLVVEDLKGILEDGSLNLMPILEIDTEEVMAEHFATIGNFSEDELFYLQTKGISRQEGLKILKNSFIYNIFSDDFQKMINNRKDKDE